MECTCYKYLLQMYLQMHEDIYVHQPEGFVAKGKEKMICKLKWSLYELKQPPREWYHKFDTW